MTRARIGRPIWTGSFAGAVDLVDGSLGYDRSLAEYFPALLAAHHG